MMSMATALSGWLTRFGLPVYLSVDVPDDAVLPYITIPLTQPEWSSKATYYIQVWYRTKTNVPVIDKADEVISAIGTGVRIPCNGGYVVIWPETPIIQMMIDGDVRSAYINLSVNSYQMPGV